MFYTINGSKGFVRIFLNLRQDKSEEEIHGLLENYEINKLDINRIYRYLDKYSSHDACSDDIDDEDSVASSDI